MVSLLVVGTNTYALAAAADTYLEDSVRGGAWSSMGDDDKARALISAFRILERQCWQGQKTVSVQSAQWPREDLTYADGTAVDSSVTPTQIVSGQIELAFDLSQDPDFAAQAGTGSNISSLGAGSARISYFRPTGGVAGAGGPRFPPEVQELVGQFMCGFGSVAGITVHGIDAESSFDTNDSLGLNQGLP